MSGSPAVETLKIKKDKTVLIGDYYQSPKTSLLIFHFDPENFSSSKLRMDRCPVTHLSIDHKDLYTFDGFFQPKEKGELRDFFANASYSRTSYGTAESIEKGEKPAYSMNTKERWDFFAHPPISIQEVHKLLSYLAYQLDVDITTMPWELAIGSTSIVLPSVIVNYHNVDVSQESMKLGKHQDFNPEKGLFFGVPVLYGKEGEWHDTHFSNGTPGKPWFVSMMLYSTSEDFDPSYGLGTVFFTKAGELVTQVKCTDGRLVLFEGDIFHGPEASTLPPTGKPWRISYVLKLIFNPRHPDQDVKKVLFDLLAPQ